MIYNSTNIHSNATFLKANFSARYFGSFVIKASIKVSLTGMIANLCTLSLRGFFYIYTLVKLDLSIVSAIFLCAKFEYMNKIALS